MERQGDSYLSTPNHRQHCFIKREKATMGYITQYGPDDVVSTLILQFLLVDDNPVNLNIHEEAGSQICHCLGWQASLLRLRGESVPLHLNGHLYASSRRDVYGRMSAIINPNLS